MTARNLFFTLGLAGSFLACEKKENIQNSPGAANPDYPSAGMAPDGNSGAVRNALPASGAAATGAGNTASDTSAASGAVDLKRGNEPSGKDGSVTRPDSVQPTYNTTLSQPSEKALEYRGRADSQPAAGDVGTGVQGSGSSSSDQTGSEKASTR